MNDPKRKSDQSDSNPVPDKVDEGSATAMFRNPLDGAPAHGTKSEWTELEAASSTPDLFPKKPPVSDAVVQNKPAEPASEFTQFFQSLAPVEPTPTSILVPANARPEAEVPPQEPGDFTRIFLQVQAPEIERTRPARMTEERSSAEPVQVPQAEDTGPGEFTRFISGLERVPPESSMVHPESGSPAQPAARNLKGFSTPGGSDFASAGPGGVTEFLRTPSTAPRASTTAKFEEDRVPPPLIQRRSGTEEQPIPFAPRREERPVPGRGQAGEFTRLMQSLSETASRPMHDGNRPHPAGAGMPPEFPAGLSAGPGEFTRLMQGLSGGAPPESEAMPGFERAAQAPPQQTVSHESGDFTRVISGSLLREAQHAQSAPKPVTAAAPAQPFSGLPPAPILHTPPPAPFPHAPGLPAANPKGKLERYLPLLLILNGFLLVVLILLVIFSLRSR